MLELEVLGDQLNVYVRWWTQMLIYPVYALVSFAIMETLIVYFMFNTKRYEYFDHHLISMDVFLVSFLLQVTNCFWMLDSN